MSGVARGGVQSRSAMLCDRRSVLVTSDRLPAGRRLCNAAQHGRQQSSYVLWPAGAPNVGGEHERSEQRRERLPLEPIHAGTVSGGSLDSARRPASLESPPLQYYLLYKQLARGDLMPM